MSSQTSTPTVTPTEQAPRRRYGALLPWLVALVAVAVAVFTTFQWRQLAAQEQARDEVEAAASTFLLELTTWDASDGLGDTRAALTALGTGPFLDEVDELFGGDLGTQLREVGAASQGEVQDVFVQRIEGDRAEVFAVLLQIQGSAVSDEETIRRSARLILERVDGEWRIARVDMVDPGTADTGDVPPVTGEDGP